MSTLTKKSQIDVLANSNNNIKKQKDLQRDNRYSPVIAEICVGKFKAFRQHSS